MYMPSSQQFFPQDFQQKNLLNPPDCALYSLRLLFCLSALFTLSRISTSFSAAFHESCADLRGGDIIHHNMSLYVSIYI